MNPNIQLIILFSLIILSFFSCKKIEPGVKVMQFKNQNTIPLSSTYGKIDTINLSISSNSEDGFIINKADTNYIKTLFIDNNKLIIKNFVESSYSFEIFLLAYGIVQDTINITISNTSKIYVNQILFRSGSYLGIVNQSGTKHVDHEKNNYRTDLKINNSGTCMAYSMNDYPYLQYFGSSKTKLLTLNSNYYEVSNFSGDGQSVILTNYNSNFIYLKFSDSTSFTYSLALKSGESLRNIHYINHSKNEAVYVVQSSPFYKVIHRNAKGVAKTIDSVRINYNGISSYGTYDFVEINKTGTHLLFCKKYYSYSSGFYNGYENNLILYNVDTKNKTTIDLNQSFLGASFSPDGSKFVYSDYYWYQSSYDLYVRGIYDYYSTNITNSSYKDELYPTW